MGSERVVNVAVRQRGDELKVREFDNFSLGFRNAGKVLMN